MAKKQYQLVSCTINGREVEQMVDVARRSRTCSATTIT